MVNEGSIKFNCIRKSSPISIPDTLFCPLNKYRAKLFKAQLIGSYADEVGYGNISVRKSTLLLSRKEGAGLENYNQFYITASGTGGLGILQRKHISLVTSWSHERNMVECTGEMDASAESLSHAAVYESDPKAGAVIHVHHKGMWANYLGKFPTSSHEALYGTPEMAKEIQRIVTSMSAGEAPIIIMGGHEEGILVWGRSLDDAGDTLWNVYQMFLTRK